MSTESEGIFIDTNILIYSTFPDFDSEKHIQSLESLNKLLQSDKPLFVSNTKHTALAAIFQFRASSSRLLARPLS